MKNRFLTKEDWLRIAQEYIVIGPTSLAKELGVSKQRVQQIATYLRKNGIEVERYGSDRKEYIDFVKKNIKNSTKES